MKGTLKVLLIIVFSLMSLVVMAKSTGKFSSYRQITDKEILLTSTKGVKVLITAYENSRLGFAFYDKSVNVQLLSPGSISHRNDLFGSIYVEELDELMQITTINSDGFSIQIDKKHFGFVFIDKQTAKEYKVMPQMLAGIISNADHKLMVEFVNFEQAITEM